MWRKIGYYLVAVCLVASICLVGCSAPEKVTPKPEQPKPEPERVIRLGACLPFSGGQAIIGDAIGGLLKLHCDEANAQGGLLINGKKYKLEYYQADSKYDAAGTVTAARKLLDENKVEYIAGPVPSSGVLAVEPILEQAKVPWFYISSTRNPLIKVAKGELTMPFSMAGVLDYQLPLAMKAMKKNHPEVKRVALLAPDDESGYTYAKDTEKACEFAGVELVTKVFVPRKTTDFHPYITPLLAEKPDLIDLDNPTAGDMALEIKQIREKGYKGLFITTLSVISPKWLEIAGGWEAIEGMISGSEPDPEDPLYPKGMLDLQQRWIAKYDKWNPLVTRYGPGAASAIIGILKVSDSPSVEDFMAAAESGRAFQTELGETKVTTLGRNGHCPTMPFFITEVKGGVNTVLAKYEPDEILEFTKLFER